MGNNVWCGGEGKPLNQHLVLGNKHYDEKNYQAAVDQYSIAIQEDPKDHHGFENRARAYKELGRNQEAMADLDQVIRLDSHNFEAYNIRGQQYRDQGRIQDALNDFTHAIKINPSDHTGYVNRGDTYREQMQYEKASNDYSKAIDLDHSDIKVHESRGQCHLNLRRYEEAQADFNKVLEKDPENYNAISGRAESYYCVRNYDGAIQDYSSLLNKNPNFRDAYGYRGRAHHAQGNYKDAQSDFNEALKDNTSHPLFLFYLANSQLQQGNRDRAHESFDRGYESFFNDDKVGLSQRYNMYEQDIDYLNDQFHNFNEYLRRIDRVINEIEMNDNRDLMKEGSELRKQLIDLVIPKVAHAETRAHSNDSEIQALDAKINDLETRNKQSIKPALRNIFAQISNVDKSVYNDQKVIYKINGLEDNDRRQYYEELYNFMLNHLLAFRVCYTGYYKDNVEPFEEMPNVLEQIAYYQSFNKKMPTFSRLVRTPYLIIEKCLKQPTSPLSRNVSQKVGCSKFESDRVIQEYVAFTVLELMNNKEFNDYLLKGLNQNQEEYIKSIWDQVAQGRPFDKSKIFETSEFQESVVQEVVCAHVILIIKLLYEIDLQDFQKITEQNKTFYELVRKSLPPEQKTVKDQGLTSGDFNEMGAKPSTGCCSGNDCMIM